MKKKKPNVVFIICLIVLIVAVATIVIYQVQKHKKESAYEDLAEEVSVETEVSEEEPEEEPVVEEEPTVEIPIDFEALWEQNPDAYAWIRIADTQVDYPILQSAEGVDEDYYLDHTIDGEEGLPGALYTQYSYNSATLDDPVTVIYGHNMRNDSFFGGLSEFLDEDYRASHTSFEIYTPEHIYHYRMAFAVTYDDRHILANFDCTDQTQYDAFLTSIQTERVLPSWLEDPFNVTTDDKLVILSTCNGNSANRFLIGLVLTEVE